MAMAEGGDSLEERADRFLAVLKTQRAHECGGNAELSLKMMEHQHAPAEPMGADFEAGPIAGERILACGPRALRFDGCARMHASHGVGRTFGIVPFAVVED